MADLRKIIELDLTNVPRSEHTAVKNAVGNFVVNQVLRDIERGFSPVAGEGQFKQLNKEYANEEKGGRRTANLQLEGDLKDAIQFRPSVEGIVFGNFIAAQKDKADGHNQHSAKAKAWARSFPDDPFPKRRYIPKGSQKFREGIEREIKDIVKGFEEIPFEDVNALGENIIESGNRVEIQITDVFNEDVIAAEIRRQLSNEV